MNSKQQQYIRDNHNRQTIGEMAEHLKLPAIKVLDFIDTNDLPKRKVYQRRAVVYEKLKPGFFGHDKRFGI